MNNTKGLTLLEVLVAIALVGLAVLALSSFSTVAFQGASRAKKLTIGLTLAQAKIETIQLEGYDPLLAGREEQVESYEALEDFPLFKRTVSRVSHTPGPDMQTVEVSVYWDHDVHSVTISTILGESL